MLYLFKQMKLVNATKILEKHYMDPRHPVTFKDILARRIILLCLVLYISQIVIHLKDNTKSIPTYRENPFCPGNPWANSLLDWTIR